MARILFDSYYHAFPENRLSRNITTGNYSVNTGRYAPRDCFHPNSLSFLNAELAKQHEVRSLNQPYSELSLLDADIVLAINPDYPLYPGASPHRWTPSDVDAAM